MSRQLLAPLIVLAIVLSILWFMSQSTFANVAVPLPFVAHPATPTPAIHAVHHPKNK